MILGKVWEALPVLFGILILLWLRREPKFDWEKKDLSLVEQYKNCPTDKTSVHLLFGGTSMLGRYIVDTWKEKYPDVCLINYNRKVCKKCDVSIVGDLRDTRHIEKILNKYKVNTIILSIKPELEWTNWRTFVEVNYSALLELTKLAKAAGVKNLLYVSSIAASSHYIEHHLSNESFPAPLLTDYEAPYDLTKRMAEDYILGQHEKGKFNTIALRVSGILGGEGDPFFHHRMFPFLLTFDNPIIVDYGFAANIALALAEVHKVLLQDNSVAGKFYYYTGEHILENATAQALQEYTGKPILKFPTSLLNYFLAFWQWFRWDHNTYTLIDLMRCANVEQTFDNSLFHKTFPNFKPKFTVISALESLYKK